MKIIFLDVDGVLINNDAYRIAHEAKVREKAHPVCATQLNRIVAETGAYVVMSSCWRIGREVIEIKDLLRSWGGVLQAHRQDTLSLRQETWIRDSKMA